MFHSFKNCYNLDYPWVVIFLEIFFMESTKWVSQKLRFIGFWWRLLSLTNRICWLSGNWWWSLKGRRMDILLFRKRRGKQIHRQVTSSGLVLLSQIWDSFWQFFQSHTTFSRETLLIIVNVKGCYFPFLLHFQFYKTTESWGWENPTSIWKVSFWRN